jgi:hypothetical protein
MKFDSSVLPSPTSDADRKLLSDVEEYGWHILHVLSEGELPGWSFSVGIYHTHRHPEFIVMGLPDHVSQTIINELGIRIKNGEVFASGMIDNDVMESYPVQFLKVDRAQYKAHLGYAEWFYRHQDFPVLQIVWTDKVGHFPWQLEYERELMVTQPILGQYQPNK